MIVREEIARPGISVMELAKSAQFSLLTRILRTEALAGVCSYSERYNPA